MSDMNEHLPTPRQLRRLTMVGASSTRDRELLRTHSSRPNYYYALDRPAIDDEYAESIDTPHVRHTMGMRILRQEVASGEPGWHLEYVSSHRLRNDARRESLTAVSKYIFEWTSERTLSAKRLGQFAVNGVRLVPDLSVEDILDRQLLHVPDDACAILGGEESFSHITADDCELLTRDIADYYDRVRQLTVR